jgi:citrate synthase
MAERPEYLHTWIGSSDPDHIRVGGLDLATEVMGHMSLTELAYFLTTRRRAGDAERRLLDAVLVSLADHGLTPSALSARLTYTGAPEAVQGAIAAGLLGAGSVFLGPAGDTAIFLSEALVSRGLGATATDDELRDLARQSIEVCRASGSRVPGLGHPLHKQQDPRTARLYELARTDGLLGPHLRLLRLVGDVHEDVTGRHLPVNGAGAGGAALVDVGVPPTSVRGFVLIARTAGLVAHLAEEVESPIGHRLYAEVEHRASSASNQA